MTTYYKALRPDMSSFADPDFVYELGKWKRPKWNGERAMCSEGYIHAGTDPVAAIKYNAVWPWRLFTIEGKVAAKHGSDKVGFKQARLIEEVEPWLPWGERGKQVLHMFVRLNTATDDELERYVRTAWDTCNVGATRVVRVARVAWGARVAARDAWVWTVGAVATEHLIDDTYTREHFETLVGPWVEVFGRTWEDVNE